MPSVAFREFMRTSTLPIAVLAALFVGCARHSPPPAAAPDRSEPTTSRATQPIAPAVSRVSEPTPSPAVLTPPPAVNSPYRDLAARFLESDGQGGWRKNEKAATELEKLSPD